MFDKNFFDDFSGRMSSGELTSEERKKERKFHLAIQDAAAPAHIPINVTLKL